MKGIKIEVPDFKVTHHHDHKIEAPTIGGGFILALILVLAFFTLTRN